MKLGAEFFSTNQKCQNSYFIINRQIRSVLNQPHTKRIHFPKHKKLWDFNLMKHIARSTFFPYPPHDCSSFTQPTRRLKINQQIESPSLIISDFEEFKKKNKNKNHKPKTITESDKLSRVRYTNEKVSLQYVAELLSPMFHP